VTAAGDGVRAEMSVIIPSYNSRDKIEPCLAALRAQQVDVPFEIIVVDSSDDGTGEEIGRAEGIILLRSSERLFPGTARNRGAEAASGRILCFTDADCIPAGDWLHQIFCACRGEERTLIGGPILNGTPESCVGTAEYFSEFGSYLAGTAGGERDFFPTANAAIKTDLFSETEGFRDFEKGSDVAFGSDCRAHKIQPVFHPEVKVSHRNRTDLRGFLRNQEKLGCGAANNRKLYDLPGSWLARRRITLPLVPAARFLRIMWRCLRDGSGQRAELMRCAPLVLAGAVSFGVGFARGVGDTDATRPLPRRE
jgi:glycosyltransferase involved in cell wall biosynthesis